MQDLWVHAFFGRLTPVLVVLFLSFWLSACRNSNSGSGGYSSESPTPVRETQYARASPGAGGQDQRASMSPASSPEKPLYTSATNTLQPTSSRQTNRIYTEAQSPSQVGASPLQEPAEPGAEVMHNGAHDIGVTEADKSLARRIRFALMHDPAFSSLESAVKLSVDNGKVTLQGSVKRQSDRSSLQNFIQGVSGVKSVDDQLEVKATAQ